MQNSDDCHFSSFHVAGISYKKSDASLRGKFAVNKLQYQSLLLNKSANKQDSFFILSTCNRTEIYGLAKSADELAALLCTVTEGSLAEFDKIAYKFKGEHAVRHLFNVASGMDSQILGDYEITGQLKTCIKESKIAGRLNNFTERLINEVYAASKEIRTKTVFSSGTVSVSFAAIQFIKNKFSILSDKQILLIGTGKIGTNTCRNILDYLPGAKLTVVNRSTEKAQELANEFKINYVPYTEMHTSLQQSDIVIVSTQSPEYVVSKKDFTGNSFPSLFIDMSVPCNINRDISDLPGTCLTGVDELSKINDATLFRRSQEIPLVTNIIDKHIAEFAGWYRHRANVPKLIQMKNHLHQISKHSCPASGTHRKNKEQDIQKTLNGLAVKLQKEPLAGCNYLQALSAFLKTHSN